MVSTNDNTAQFALPRSTGGQSRHAKVSAKLSRFLARNIVISPLTMRNAKPLITFTFDDAPASACETGARLLARHGVHATYYISGGGCGLDSPGGRLAGAEQIKALCAAGHEIGCHTYSHLAVSDLDAAALLAEVERNRSCLERLDGRIRVRNFAYPYGDLSFRAKHDLEVRFETCRSLLPGINVATLDRGAIKSCELRDSAIGRAGVGEIIAATVRRRGWLIFTSHDVDVHPSQFGVSPDLLEFALQAARQAACDIVTVHDAYEIVSGGAARPAADSLAQISG